MSNTNKDETSKEDQKKAKSSIPNKKVEAEKDKRRTKLPGPNKKVDPVKDLNTSIIENDDDDDTLERLKSMNFMKLYIKPLLGGQTYEIDVSDKCTIGEVKGVLEIQYQVDTSQTILVHHDNQLEDNRTAIACGVRNNSTLYMVPKMRAGPLNYKVNTRAVNRFMTHIDEDVKDALVKLSEDSGLPLKDDDVFMLTVDDQGEIRLVRMTNDENKTKKEEDDPSKREVNVRTWDKEGENQQTRSKMENLQRKMKESRERRRGQRGKTVSAKRKREEYPAKKSADKKEG